MMMVKRVKQEVNPEQVLTVGVDVSQSTLVAYSAVCRDGDRLELTDEVANTPLAIAAALLSWERFARDHGYGRLQVACEATAGFEKRLLEQALRQGCCTCYVSGEAVSKSKVIESNDTSKTDPKDARIIFRLAADGRTLTARELPPLYAQLRELNQMYESESSKGAAVKNEFRKALHRQFAELQLTRKQLYGPVGQALASQYGFSPWAIVSEGLDRFCNRMYEAFAGSGRGVQAKTLAKIYAQAEQSARAPHEADLADLRGERLSDLFAQIELHERLKTSLQEQMLQRFRQCAEYRQLQSLPTVSDFQLARVIAETGPLSDFASHPQLARYLGMNLRVRQSGKYVGQTKLSKKGRSLGRKVLWQLVVFGMIGKGGVLAADYQSKQQTMSNSNGKALVAMMRKALRLLWGLARSQHTFNPQRVGTSDGALALAA